MIPPGLQWVHDELENWARWGREHAGPGDLPEPSIWRAWLSFKGRQAGWGLTAAQKEAEARGEIVTVDDTPSPPRIDELAAETTDAKMRYLRDHDARSYVALHKHYYRWHRVREAELHEAMRHFGDIPQQVALKRA